MANKVQKTLVGVKRFVSKKGKEFSILQLTTPFTDNEISSGSKGLKIEEQFVPDELLNKVNDLVLNKPVSFSYDVVGNRAYVTDFWSEK